MNHDNEKGCGKSALDLLSLALNLFIGVLCIVLLAYLLEPHVISYFPPFWQAMRDAIEPIGSIVGAVLIGFFCLNIIASSFRD